MKFSRVFNNNNMPGGFMFSRKVISFHVPEIVERKDVQLLFTKAIKSGGLHAVLLTLSKQKTDVSMIEIPEMINISDKVSIMRGEVTVKLFKQVMGDYTPTGHNADKLIAVLNDPSKEGKSLIYVSLLDGREFAKRLSTLSGRKFRVQKEAEWVQARVRLSGKNWTWTEALFTDRTSILRLPDDFGRANPMRRFRNIALRLVEDK